MGKASSVRQTRAQVVSRKGGNTSSHKATTIKISVASMMTAARKAFLPLVNQTSAKDATKIARSNCQSLILVTLGLAFISHDGGCQM